MFNVGEVARVAVIGDGDTDLDLYIYDEVRQPDRPRYDNTDNCLVAFTPRWTAKFRVVIANLGRVYNRYTLITN